MKIGTKSLLFGYHQFLIHPLFVARAWWKLYGFPWDPRLWFAFFTHDLGYWGKPNMDGPEGESHPWTGANIMGGLFDHQDQWGHKKILRSWYTVVIGSVCDFLFGHLKDTTWYCLTFYHSRFLCRDYNVEPSQLCYADKLAIVITPTWLQLVLMNLTGEIKEYMEPKPGRTDGRGKSQREWVEDMKQVVRGYLSEQMGTCIACGVKCENHHYLCDKAEGGQWCPACFEKTECGGGIHGEGCPTMVKTLSN